ncbi:MAG TPA: c-type cytochrome [Bryobacteraceae bacterium]|nr:c-type cytochrome [Bryobacteraceae bacterium]
MQRSYRLIGIAILAAAAAAQSPVQMAPAKFANRTNPYEGSETASMAGAKLFARECAACHGANGEGLEKAPSLRRPEVSNATPGALFWVLENGSLRNGMPSFAHLPAPQRWQIVTFLRTLSSTARPAPGP